MNTRRVVCPLDDPNAVSGFTTVVPEVVSDRAAEVNVSRTAFEGARRTEHTAVTKSVRSFQGIVGSCTDALHRLRAVGHGCKVLFSKNRPVVRHPDAFLDYFGAWEQVWPRGQFLFQPWLRSLIIADTTVLFANGHTNDLVRRSSDGACLICGCALHVFLAGEKDKAGKDDLLVRIGISGQSFVYRRMCLPASNDLDKIQGDWSIIVAGGEAASAPRLQIRGVLWKLRARGGLSTLQTGYGFLKVHDGHIMAGALKLSWRRDGQGNVVMCVVHKQYGKRFVYPCRPA